MLIAFVLLGKNLEQRAKLKATSDMTGLMNILPTTARLMVDGDVEDLTSIVEVPCGSLSVGDRIVVFPGVSNFKHFSTVYFLNFSHGNATSHATSVFQCYQNIENLIFFLDSHIDRKLRL